MNRSKHITCYEFTDRDVDVRLVSFVWWRERSYELREDLGRGFLLLFR